jgi:hypothetical protein
LRHLQTFDAPANGTVSLQSGDIDVNPGTEPIRSDIRDLAIPQLWHPPDASEYGAADDAKNNQAAANELCVDETDLLSDDYTTTEAIAAAARDANFDPVLAPAAALSGFQTLAVFVHALPNRARAIDGPPSSAAARRTSPADPPARTRARLRA